MTRRYIVDVDKIDRINILQATLQAMEGAVAALPGTQPDYLLIDGNQLPRAFSKDSSQAVVRGDSTTTIIAAASILAKVCKHLRQISKLWHYAAALSAVLSKFCLSCSANAGNQYLQPGQWRLILPGVSAYLISAQRFACVFAAIVHTACSRSAYCKASASSPAVGCVAMSLHVNR